MSKYNKTISLHISIRYSEPSDEKMLTDHIPSIEMINCSLTLIIEFVLKGNLAGRYWRDVRKPLFVIERLSNYGLGVKARWLILRTVLL